MQTKPIPGEIRVLLKGEKWTVKQWTGSHWNLLQIKNSKESIDTWLDFEWDRHPVDTSASD